jgi:hypothetical protein
VPGKRIMQPELAPHLPEPRIDIDKHPPPDPAQNLFVVQIPHDVEQTHRLRRRLQHPPPRQPQRPDHALIHPGVHVIVEHGQTVVEERQGDAADDDKQHQTNGIQVAEEEIEEAGQWSATEDIVEQDLQGPGRKQTDQGAHDNERRRHQSQLQ